MKNHPGVGQRTDRADVDMTIGFIEPRSAKYVQNRGRPGVYANATILEPFRRLVYSYVDTPFGMSIHGDGELERPNEPPVNNKVTKIDKIFSVDLVVRPGAGGAIVDVLESIRDCLLYTSPSPRD